MSDCCHSNCDVESSSRTHRCPVNGRAYKPVGLKTIVHHLKAPWNWSGGEQGYYFCDDPDCPVVYFGDDGSVIDKTALRTGVGIKEHMPGSLACYCFGVSYADAQREPAIRDYIIAKTKAGICACETSNPAGRCCLRDYPAAADRRH